MSGIFLILYLEFYACNQRYWRERKKIINVKIKITDPDERGHYNIISR